MTLFVVATPIGNLGDISFRAVATLRQVDLIAAEDTRVARQLLTHYEITTPVTSCHAHSSEREIAQILDRLRAGKSVALISDAGTPGISDPGYRLITAAIAAGVSVSPIPGCCALVAALCASGLPMDKFVYLGFLPIKKGRQTLLRSLITEKRTAVFYESVHRIAKTLAQLQEALGPDRRVVVAREITKMFEEFFRGDLAGAQQWVSGAQIKGEFVILLGPANLGAGSIESESDLID